MSGIDDPKSPMYQADASTVLPPVPKDVRKALFTIGGPNPMGQPNLRLVSGLEVRAFCNGNPQAIKYANPNDVEVGWACLILERWASREFFNPTVWAEQRYGPDPNSTGKQIDFLGPFPRKGDYVFCAPMVDSLGVRLELTAPWDKILSEIADRVSFGPAPDALGRMEVARRRKTAQNKTRLKTALDEWQEWTNANAEKFKAAASRKIRGRRQGPALEYLQQEARAKVAELLLKSKGATANVS